MEIVRLKSCDFEEAIDFLDFVFSKAYSPTHFRKMLPLCYQPTDEHMSHNFAIRENGKIRAIVGLFPAQIQVGDEILNLGGIGGVSAHPNDRGKGWMKLLMNRSIEEMKSTNTDLSFLIGLRQRYQYFGYEKAGILLEYKLQQTNIRHTFQNSCPSNSDLHFVPLTASDLPYLKQIKKLHDRQPFYCIRPLSDFYLYLVAMNTKPWVALYPNGEVAGYLVTNQKQDRVTEIFAENDSVFSAMIYRWFAQREIIESTVLLAPWQESYARFLSGIAEEYHLVDNGNWRIYNWEKVIGSLLTLKNAQHSLYEGSLSIGIKDYGTLYIRVANGTVECRKTNLHPDIEWDPLTATRVLLGHFPAAFSTEIPESLKALIESWFPLPLCWLVQNYV